MKKLIILTGLDSNTLVKVINSEEFNNHKKYQFPEVGNNSIPLSGKEQVEFVYDTFRNLNDNFVLCTHSEIIFNAIRVKIYHSSIDSNEVEIRWYGFDSEYKIIKIDKNARFAYQPCGFFSTLEHLLCQLLIPKP